MRGESSISEFDLFGGTAKAGSAAGPASGLISMVDQLLGTSPDPEPAQPLSPAAAAASEEEDDPVSYISGYTTESESTHVSGYRHFFDELGRVMALALAEHWRVQADERARADEEARQERSMRRRRARRKFKSAAAATVLGNAAKAGGTAAGSEGRRRRAHQQ